MLSDSWKLIGPGFEIRSKSASLNRARTRQDHSKNSHHQTLTFVNGTVKLIYLSVFSPKHSKLLLNSLAKYLIIK